MGDEVQIIQVAFQGTEMFFRIGEAAIKDALKFLKFLACCIPNAYRWNQEMMDKYYRKQMTKAEWNEIKRMKKKLHSGEVPLDEMMKRYKNSELTLLSIPDSSTERFADLAKKNKLYYSALPDLNVEDGVFQVMVPAEQAEVYNSVLQTMSREEEKDREAASNEIDEKMKQTEEERIKAVSEKKQMEKDGREVTEPDHYKEVCGVVAYCDRRMAELEKQLTALDNQESREISIEDYMNTNQQAMNHVDLFMDMQEKGAALSGTATISDFVKMPDKSELLNIDKRKLLKTVTFEAAMSSLPLGKEIVEPMIICCKNSPANFMEITSRSEEYEDRDYMNTEFRVFRDGVEQRCDEFSHGKFTHYSDRQAGNSSEAGEEHWQNMQKEMKEKGGFDDELLLFQSKKDYEEFAKESSQKPENKLIYGDRYLTNPAMPDMVIRRDKLLKEGGREVEAYRYTMMQSGADTGIIADFTYLSPQESRIMFLKQANQEIRRQNPDADLKEPWMVFDNKEDFEIYVNSVKKNVRTDTENLKEEFVEVLGEEKEPLTRQMNQESKQEVLQKPDQTILQIPPKKMATMNLGDGPDRNVVLFSKDMNLFVKIAEDKSNPYKQDMEGNTYITLKENESFPVMNKYTGREVGRISNQKNLNDFLNNQGAYTGKGKEVTLQKGEEKHAATLRKQYT